MVLKQAYCCDPGGTGIETLPGVGQSHSAQRQYRNFSFADLAEFNQACWPLFRKISLLENWRQHGEGRAIGCGLSDLFWGVT